MASIGIQIQTHSTDRQEMTKNTGREKEVNQSNRGLVVVKVFQKEAFDPIFLM